jgi:hypothetical protein
MIPNSLHQKIEKNIDNCHPEKIKIIMNELVRNQW